MIKLLKLKGEYNTGTYIDPDNIAYIRPNDNGFGIYFKQSTGCLVMRIDEQDLQRLLNLHDVR